MLLLLVAMLLVAASSDGASIRVTTWNLQPSLAATNAFSAQYQSNLIVEAAKTIKKLNPDVVLLHQVGGWESCGELVKALLPANYSVAVCSSFLDPQTRKLASEQVAILTKNKAFLSWSERWRGNPQIPAPEGGYAFAAIRTGNKKIGFFCTLISDKTTNSLSAQTAQCARELSAQIEIVSHWKANRLQAQFIAGEFDKGADGELKPFAQLGFESPAAKPGSEEAVLGAHILTRDGGEASHVQVSHAELVEYPAITSEFDLVPKPLPVVAAAVPAAKTVEAKTNAPAAQPPVAKASETSAVPASPERTKSILALALMVAMFLMSLLLVIRSKRARAQNKLVPVRSGSITPAHTDSGKILIVPPANEPPYVRIEVDGVSQVRAENSAWTNEIPAPLREGMIRHLSAWLKTRFVRKLVSDRAQLIETQQAAALKVLAVDERLTKIERHIQQRNRDYEERIDALLKELEIAREENRELIRAKIAALRAEMEKNERT